MKTKLLYFVILFCISIFSLQSQNLLNTNTWSIGSGSVSGFGQNGSTSENSREYGSGPDGTSVLLWKATPDAASGPDGGWNTSHYDIDHTKTYRLVVWIKKTNSTDGNTYFGFQSYHSGNHHSLRLNGTENNNPYFWAGDLPQLNKWFMLVGYVHGSNYNATAQYGGIYDPITGLKVKNITDYKFKSTSKKLGHRTYLYYDTNTSDRQYFYAPRMELVNGNEPSIQELLGVNSTNPTNLLASNLNNWTVGTGSVSGFTQNGSTSENSRVTGRNHIGEKVILWKATPDANSNADGGWNTGWYNANHNTTHRYSVWIKKTGSNNGSTYLGFYANNSGSLKLNGAFIGNPYFFAGDLPKLNRWYLIVGYVHKSSYTGTSNTGGIYDGTTGEKIRTITDYKLKNTVTAIRHRSYLYYDTNTLDTQYFYEPRIDPVLGNEPTIKELLKINDDSKLIVSHDVAGNQTQNFYCGDPVYCSPPAARKVQKQKSEEYVSENIEEEIVEEIEEESILEGKFTVYPNPTKNFVTINLGKNLLKNLHEINLYDSTSVLIKRVDARKENIVLDLTSVSTGVYFIHIHLANGKSITSKIIKK